MHPPKKRYFILSKENQSKLIVIEKMLSRLENATISKLTIDIARVFEDITPTQAFALVGRFPSFIGFKKKKKTFTDIKYNAIFSNY